MTERRRWKAEEKLALISEIREKAQVVETCRKYGVDPSMFCTWKEILDTNGVDGLDREQRKQIPA
ncbi:MAG: hypothetical protein B2I17_00270 [Thermoplasmatales archaeon B_DKE]|nr:MAG: hypothetical protein B2I17_00270 [Thermoplasmatales archaeon B_DKE]